jgi:hypothetical protein
MSVSKLDTRATGGSAMTGAARAAMTPSGGNVLDLNVTPMPNTSDVMARAASAAGRARTRVGRLRRSTATRIACRLVVQAITKLVRNPVSEGSGDTDDLRVAGRTMLKTALVMEVRGGASGYAVMSVRLRVTMWWPSRPG